MADRRPTRLADLPVAVGTVYLVGVAGAGMRALATIFMDRGWTVRGSDRDASAAVDLAGVGLEIHADDEGEGVVGSDIVVYSSAVPEGHPALVAAREHGIPTWKRSRALGAIVNDLHLVAVAGTHGKTTVTTMLAMTLVAAGRDPLAVVGGHVDAWSANARSGSGDTAVVEADEYDRSFLELDPDLAIVTSVEPEHLDIYGDAEAMVAAYREFAARAGRVLVSADDTGAASLGRSLARLRTVRTYGFDPTADYRLERTFVRDGGQQLTIRHGGQAFHSRLAAPGRHNAQNGGAALAAAAWLGCHPDDVEDCLADFSGVERRLQVLYEAPELIVVDDYAHHPTEVEAGIEALRSGWPDRRLIVFFQPHLYTRTRDQASAFAVALARADRAYVLPIYPAREEPIPGVTHELITGVCPPLQPVDRDRVAEVFFDLDPEPTLVAFMGAGDVTHLARELARSANRRSRELGG